MITTFLPKATSRPRRNAASASFSDPFLDKAGQALRRPASSRVSVSWAVDST